MRILQHRKKEGKENSDLFGMDYRFVFELSGSQLKGQMRSVAEFTKSKTEKTTVEGKQLLHVVFRSEKMSTAGLHKAYVV